MTLKIAHRGHASEPENTLRSFKKALSLGADMIETDLRLTKDNHIILFHDYKLNRTTNGKGNICDYTFKEIRKLDAGKGEKIPTLNELIDLTKGKCKLNLEIKDSKCINKVLKIIDIKKVKKDVLISSPDLNVLKQSKKNKIKVSYILCPSKTAWQTWLCIFVHFFILPFTIKKILKSTKKINIDIICLYKHLTTTKRKKLINNAGMKLYVWTVNKEKNIKKFKKMGVAGIFSDYIDKF